MVHTTSEGLQGELLRAVAVTAGHCCSLRSDPLLWEVTWTPRSCSCHGAVPALAAKEVLSPASCPYFKEASLDTAESALAQSQGLENSAFGRTQSQRKGFLQREWSL